MYQITQYTKDKARQAGLVIKPSSRKWKKIDVFKNGNYLDSIGDTRYGDYPTFVKEKGSKYAEERRRLYHLRHTKNTLGEQLALYLLW